MGASILDQAREIVEIAQVQKILDGGQGSSVFTAREREFAATKSDPARRLAARFAAKKAAARLLGGVTSLSEIEVVRTPGFPPRLELHAQARERLLGRGASRVLVSLTHSRRYAAAVVLLLRDEVR